MLSLQTPFSASITPVNGSPLNRNQKASMVSPVQHTRYPSPPGCRGGAGADRFLNKTRHRARQCSHRVARYTADTSLHPLLQTEQAPLTRGYTRETQDRQRNQRANFATLLLGKTQRRGISQGNSSFAIGA